MQRAIYILSALKLAEAAAVEDHLEATAPEDEQALVQTEATTLAQTEDDEPSQLDTMIDVLAELEANSDLEEAKTQCAENLREALEDRTDELLAENELAQVENVDWTPHGDLKDLAGMSGIVLRDLPAV